jgi:integrase
MKGHIRARGKDTWRLFVDLRHNPGELRKQETQTFHGTKGAARAELRKMLARVDAGLRHDAGADTVGELLRRWLDDVAKISVTSGTFEKYEEIVDKHLVPAFGTIKVRDLKASDIQSVYARWLVDGCKGKKGGGALSPVTIRKQHAVLHRALKTARRWRLVSENAADEVDLPRADATSRKRFLSAAQCQKLLATATAEGSRLQVPILLMLETGMRRGELLALRWQDVDYKAQRVLIKRAIERTEEHGLRFKEPKSGKSRVITLSEGAIEALRAHWETQGVERQACVEQAGSYDDQDLVFPMPWGGTWDPPAFGLAFRRLAKRALGDEAGNIGPHVLRHTATTLMLQQGLGPKVVADRLGHSTTRMTMDVYAHVAPELEERAAGAVAAAIAAVASGASVTNPLPKPGPGSQQAQKKTPQTLAAEGIPMVGTRGFEPLTPTVSM